MEIPDTFIFNQHNLQDYIDCPKLFFYRHVKKISWPTPFSEQAADVELALEQGVLFHRFVDQYFRGIPIEIITRSIEDEKLLRWWQNFLLHSPESLAENRRSEFSLSAEISGYRFLGKFDLLAIEAGKQCTIVDWKTSLKQPSKINLSKRMQTRLYLTLVSLCAGTLSRGTPIQPHQIEMIYWYAEFPTHPISFQYTVSEFEKDRHFFQQLVKEILNKPDDDLAGSTNDRICSYCNFRTLCNRAVNLTEQDDDTQSTEESAISLDFEQIGEIAF